MSVCNFSLQSLVTIWTKIDTSNIVWNLLHRVSSNCFAHLWETDQLKVVLSIFKQEQLHMGCFWVSRLWQRFPICSVLVCALMKLKHRACSNDGVRVPWTSEAGHCQRVFSSLPMASVCSEQRMLHSRATGLVIFCDWKRVYRQVPKTLTKRQLSAEVPHFWKTVPQLNFCLWNLALHMYNGRSGVLLKATFLRELVKYKEIRCVVCRHTQT